MPRGVRSNIEDLGPENRTWKSLPEPDESLADRYPEVAATWDYERNAPWRPEDFKPRSGIRAWWRCEKHGSFPALICYRTMLYPRKDGTVRFGTQCPKCARKVASPENCLAGKHPTVAAEWHPELNGDLTPEDVCPTSSKRAWWLCPEGHEFEATIANRTAGGTGCPYCYPAWTLPRLRKAFGELLPRLKRVKRPETLDRILLESQLFYATRTGAVLVGELRAGRLPLAELALFAAGELSLVDEMLEDPVLCGSYSRPKYVSKKLREEVFARDGHHCLICGTDERLTADHILPVVFGGETTLDNLQTLCRSCNARKWCLVPDDVAKRLGITYRGRNKRPLFQADKSQRKTAVRVGSGHG